MVLISRLLPGLAEVGAAVATSSRVLLSEAGAAAVHHRLSLAEVGAAMATSARRLLSEARAAAVHRRLSEVGEIVVPSIRQLLFEAVAPSRFVA